METTTDGSGSPQKKRQPSGACTECGTPIVKSKRYCRPCADLVAERKRKAKDGYITIPSPAGVIEVQVPKVGISKAVVFDAYRFGPQKWDENTRCGELIDVQLGILHARPPYLTERDTRRHMGLLLHLKNHRVPAYEQREPSSEAVEDFPLRRLERAVRSWVCSWFQGEHALVSCFALDTAELILAHSFGFEEFRTQTRAAWKIAPLLPRELISVIGRSRSLLDEPTFKRDITTVIQHSLAVAKVPPRGRCVEDSSGKVLLSPGDEFIVEIMRCHRSASLDDWPMMTAIDDDEPEFSLSRDFEIPCRFIAQHKIGAKPLMMSGRDEQVRLPIQIPGRWLTHVLTRVDRKDPWVPVPLPAWLMG